MSESVTDAVTAEDESVVEVGALDVQLLWRLADQARDQGWYGAV